MEEVNTDAEAFTDAALIADVEWIRSDMKL